MSRTLDAEDEAFLVYSSRRWSLIVFISYSIESPGHTAQVRALADRLESEGVRVLLDQYNPDPPEGWPLWMAQSLQNADLILTICTETYNRRLMGMETPGVGLGVRYEGNLIANMIFTSDQPNLTAKFIPVLLEGGLPAHIPMTLLGRARYILKSFSVEDPGFSQLVLRLTGHKPSDANPGGTPNSRPRSLDFRIVPEGDQAAPTGYLVNLSCEGSESTSDRFDGDPWNEETTAKSLKAIAAGCDDEDCLRYVGSQLWSGLFAGRVGELFRKLRRDSYNDGRVFHLRLILPRSLESLPWEAMYDADGGGFLATLERFCVIRGGSTSLDPAAPWSSKGRTPGILMVLPGGSGLDLSRERKAVLGRAATQGDAVRVSVLDGTVTLDRLRDEIRTGKWDIVHFAGHGRSGTGDVVELALNDEQGEVRWVGADAFATLFNNSRVRAVFLNCCRGGSVVTDRGVAALGPILLGRGLVAVIAMRYEVTDDVAVRFADEFYRSLLTGEEPGRIDKAVEAARVAVYQNPSGESRRGFITPVLYLAPGGERVFPLEPPRPPEPVLTTATFTGATPTIQTGGAGIVVPPGLLQAVRERRCVPVLGPGLLADLAKRDLPPPVPINLLRTLAKATLFPECEDFDMIERGCGWLDSLVLRRVCQHIKSDDDYKFQLFQLIEEAFSQHIPPAPYLTMAGWDVPGYICLYIDGLLEQALTKLTKKFVVLDKGATVLVEPALTRLVHLCGTWRENDENMLTLTERQHDALWDWLAKPPAWLQDLTQGSGRTLLFLGSHPRDPLARRLASKLLDPSVTQRAGPVYFVHHGPTAADEAYWKDIKKVHWIDQSPAALIAAIDSSLAVAPGGGRP